MKAGRPAHLGFLDSLRGVAIALVFLYHSLGTSFGHDQLEWRGMFRNFETSGSFLLLVPITYGWLGVAVFFAISGFCIHLSHARSAEPGFGVFFMRRWFRIYPPYIVCLCVFFFLPPWSHWSLFSLSHHPHQIHLNGTLPDFLAHAAAVQNFDSSAFFGINPSFWSIAVEAQLYLLYPLLWLYARRRGWMRALWLTAVIELSIGAMVEIATIAYPDIALPRIVTNGPFSYWFSWCIGATAADAYLSARRIRIAKWQLWVLGAAVGGGLFWKPVQFLMFPMAAALTTGIIVVLMNHPKDEKGTVLPGLVTRALSSLGRVSYSFYLLHQPIVQLVPVALAAILPTHVHPLVKFACCLVAFLPIFYLAKLFYRFVEVPSISAGKVHIARHANLVSRNSLFFVS